MEAVVDYMASLPTAVTYIVLALGAALENIVPPIPADTFVLLAGFLSARGPSDAITVFGVTWGANVATAMLVYALGYRFGPSAFETGFGRRLLNPRQLELMGRFYDRWGVPAIFFTRFLPGLRAVVPVFAGVTHQRPILVALPVLGASALWYGALVWIGAKTGQNLDPILAWLRTTNRVLMMVAVILFLALVLAWKATRVGADGADTEAGK